MAYRTKRPQPGDVITAPGMLDPEGWRAVVSEAKQTGRTVQTTVLPLCPDGTVDLARDPVQIVVSPAAVSDVEVVGKMESHWIPAPSKPVECPCRLDRDGVPLREGQRVRLFRKAAPHRVDGAIQPAISRCEGCDRPLWRFVSNDGAISIVAHGRNLLALGPRAALPPAPEAAREAAAQPSSEGGGDERIAALGLAMRIREIGGFHAVEFAPLFADGSVDSANWQTYVDEARGGAASTFPTREQADAYAAHVRNGGALSAGLYFSR